MDAWLARGKELVTQAQSELKELLHHGDKEAESKDELATRLGVTSALCEFVESFSLHPLTFVKFPINEAPFKLAEEAPEWEMTELQKQHAVLVLEKCPNFAQLRFKVCPRYLDDTDFWRIYFLLCHRHITTLLPPSTKDNANSLINVRSPLPRSQTARTADSSITPSGLSQPPTTTTTTTTSIATPPTSDYEQDNNSTLSSLNHPSLHMSFDDADDFEAYLNQIVAASQQGGVDGLEDLDSYYNYSPAEDSEVTSGMNKALARAGVGFAHEDKVDEQ